jgi:hypothetical protein
MSRWIIPVIAIGLVARVAAAEPPLQFGGPCPDYASYKSAMSLHQYWAASACRDEGSDDCIAERASIAKLEDMMHQCEAGMNVGPPPSQAELQRMTAAASPAAGGPRVRTRGVFEAMGGGAVAAANSDWRHAVELSPTFTLGIGGMHDTIGGVVSGSWTPERLTSLNAIIPGTTIERSLHRFRVIASFVIEQHVLPELAVGARFGAGVDVDDVDFRKVVGGSALNQSATDIGFAAEVAGTAWWRIDPNVELGGALVVPISHHSTTGAMDQASFSFTSTDLELMVGVRVRTGQ